MSLLTEILAAKAEEVAARRARSSIGDLDRVNPGPRRDFIGALAAKRRAGAIGLVAEIKKASPSQGVIREDFRPADIARAYAAGGAACLSVLTDERYFQGHAAYAAVARAVTDLPVLRKDFLIDPWQVAEARAIGADAILVIVAALDDGAMREIEAAASERGLAVLAEVHDEAELERALTRLETQLIGINNRNLATFETDLSVTERLAPRIPADRLAVSESGIGAPADGQRLVARGVSSFLVGESLMRAPDISAATRALCGAAENCR